MDKPSSSLQALARRLLAIEAANQSKSDPHVHEAVRVCNKLKISLARLAGAEGFASLLRRSLALARAHIPSLSQVTLKPDGSIDGLDALAAKDPETGLEAGAAIIAHLLRLLVTFIGEPITLRLVREAWPNASLDEQN